MSTAPIDRRQQRAYSIIERGDIHEVKPGKFRVRDIDGSKTWHETTAKSCSCFDFRRTGLKCKHQIAVERFKVGPVGLYCPDCGSATKAELVWCGKGGFKNLGICTRNPEHKAANLS